MMRLKTEKSIRLIIKQQITRRILICLACLIIVFISLTIYSFDKSFEQLTKRLLVMGQEMSEFIISQVLIDNQRSIDLATQKASQETGFNIKWINQKVTTQHEKISFSFPASWTYDYPIISFNKNTYGVLKITGSLLDDKILVNQLIFMFSLLIFALITAFTLLLPLARKIPKELFVDPINDLLIFIKNRQGKIKEEELTSSFSEIHLISQEILSLFNEVQEKSQEAAIGKVAAQVAHDIRSPLAALQILTEQQLSELEESKRILLRNSVYQIRDIINNLDQNAFPNERTPTQIAILLEHVISERRTAFSDKSVTINQGFGVEAYSYFINVIPSEMKRVLTNVINNAAEAFPTKQGIIDIGLSLEKNKILLTIIDNGKGIPPDILHSLFKRGFTTKQSGSGLGLYHAQEKITQWDGTIDIKSQVSEGTTLSIQLPQITPPRWFIDHLSIPHNCIVICVDDSVSIWNAWQERFKDFERAVELKYCNDKSALLRELGNDEKRICTYLVDYEFSGKDYNGIDLIEKILKFKKEGDSVFLVTSHAKEEIQNFCVENNIFIISKVFALKIPIYPIT